MNYKKVYTTIISAALQRSGDFEGYGENHHIHPRSMGGSDCESNMVRLTAREHYICHWLLWKIHRNDKMAFAWRCMQRRGSDDRYITSRGYEHAKKLWSERIRKTRRKVVSAETRRKMSIAKIGSTPHNKGVKGLVKRPSKQRVEYEKNPKKCRCCDAEIEFKRRANTYCSPQCCNKMENKNKRYNAKPNSGSFKKGHRISEDTRLKISEAMKKVMEKKRNDN